MASSFRTAARSLPLAYISDSMFNAVPESPVANALASFKVSEAVERPITERTCSVPIVPEVDAAHWSSIDIASRSAPSAILARSSAASASKGIFSAAAISLMRIAISSGCSLLNVKS